MAIHGMKKTTIDDCEIGYFYTREKNDRNGNPRYRVFIIYLDGTAIYERIFKCYESQIPDRVAACVENEIGVTIPF